MKKVMTLLGSAIFIAALTVACGGNNNANNDTIAEEMDAIDTVLVEEVADTTPIEEEVVAPVKKTTTPKAQKKEDPTAKNTNTSGSKLAGVQQVNAPGADIRKDEQKKEMQKAAQTLNVSNQNDTKKK